MTIAELAEAAYVAYANYLEWHHIQGRELPPWSGLGANAQHAWMAAVSRVTQHCGVVIDAPPGEDDACLNT